MRPICWLVVIMPFLGADAAAQETVNVYGRVQGSDQATAVPATWVVRVAAEYPGDKFDDGRNSDAEIFIQPVVAAAAVRIHFQAIGYRRAVTDFDTYSTNTRVRPDVVLERITASMPLIKSGKPGALAAELEAEAEIARATGATEIFEANLSKYRTAAKARPEYVAEVDAFKQGNTYREIKIIGRRDLSNPDILQQLVEDPAMPVDRQVADDLAKYVRDSDVFPGVRSLLLDHLSRQALAEDVKPVVVELARELVEDDEALVRIAGQGALIRLEGLVPSSGPAADGASSDRGWSAEAMEWARLPSSGTPGTDIQLTTGTISHWLSIAEGTGDPADKVTAVRVLSQSSDEAATRALIKAMDSSSPAAARLEAAKALAVRAPGDKAVQKALEAAAKADVSGDVRLVAAGAVKAAANPK